MHALTDELGRIHVIPEIVDHAGCEYSDDPKSDHTAVSAPELFDAMSNVAIQMRRLEFSADSPQSDILDVAVQLEHIANRINQARNHGWGDHAWLADEV